jgi:hypothetical protein
MYFRIYASAPFGTDAKKSTPAISHRSAMDPAGEAAMSARTVG